MIDIEFSREIKSAAPGLTAIVISAEVENNPTSDELWNEIMQTADQLRQSFRLEDINKRPGIRATRDAYKKLGKEPNRYRPSAEALCRRIINGKSLYRSSALVDIINLISIKSGYSIGGFDANKIEGDNLILGRGEEGEPFQAIGRGPLNISGLPVYRDGKGGIGTPTSDEERTKLTSETQHLLMIINAYAEDMPFDDTVALTRNLLTGYADAKNIRVQYFIPNSDS